MTRLLRVAFALVAAALTQSQAQAFCFPVCPPPCCLTYTWQPVTSYRPEWREEKVPIVVQRCSYRKEVTPVKVQVWVPRWVDEQVRTSYYVPVPREVVREVPRCVWVAVTTFDPCTCCSYVSYCPQWVTDKVRCVEYDVRREERVDNVKVCRWATQDTVVEQVRWVPELTQENSWTVRRYCVWVPYQTMVCVPVYCCP